MIWNRVSGWWFGTWSLFSIVMYIYTVYIWKPPTRLGWKTEKLLVIMVGFQLRRFDLDGWENWAKLASFLGEITCKTLGEFSNCWRMVISTRSTRSLSQSDWWMALVTFWMVSCWSVFDEATAGAESWLFFGGEGLRVIYRLIIPIIIPVITPLIITIIHHPSLIIPLLSNMINIPRNDQLPIVAMFQNTPGG